MYTRDGVLIGKEVKLRAVFIDDLGEVVPLDSLPVVHLYDPSVSLTTVLQEAEDQSWSSQTGSPITASEVSPGLYEVVYTVPTTWAEGRAHDVWDALFSGVRDYAVLSFQVEDNIQANGTQLNKNEVLTLVLDDSIAALDSNKKLISDLTYTWITELEPFCVSVELVRMTLGPAIGWISDCNLAMMIYWSSIKAHLLTPPHICDKEWYMYAKAQFIIYDIAEQIYLMPGGPGHPGGQGRVGGGAKRLGDLSITRNSVATGKVLSSGIDSHTLDEIKDKKKEWFRILNSGACLTLGQMMPAGWAIPGWNVPGRVVPGRLPMDNDNYPYHVATQNDKFLPSGHYRTRNRYRPRSPFHKKDWSKW